MSETLALATDTTVVLSARWTFAAPPTASWMVSILPFTLVIVPRNGGELTAASEARGPAATRATIGTARAIRCMCWVLDHVRGFPQPARGSLAIARCV